MDNQFIHTFSFILTTLLIQSVASQTAPNQQQPQFTTFTPSIAVIIIVLITALFFLAFFSIYIRHCSDTTLPGRGGTVRPLTARSRRNAARGLDPSLIEALPTFPYSEVKHLKIGKNALECAVCLNEFQDDETLRLLPKCDHVFHPECIDEWLTSHTTCPVCRANLAEPDTVKEEEDTVADVISDEPEAVTIDVADDIETENRSRTLNQSKLPRSHTTGHSLVQPGENVDRFTLKLPDQIRQEIMTRTLNRTTSLVVLPRETSTRRGYRTMSGGEGSSRGNSYRRLESFDRPDRWMFSMQPPFLARESSMKKTNRNVNGSEGVETNKRFNLIGRLSFNRFGGSKRNEQGLMGKDGGNNTTPSESSLPV